MTTSVGTVYVDVQPKMDGFSAAVNRQLDPVLSGLGGKFGKFGGAAAVGVAAIGTAAVATGKQLYDIGGQFDGAYDAIRTATGKTGKSLEGLERDFKQVVKSVPTDFGSASEAVSGLSTRLDITGKPLQNLSKQVLELSRLTKTDLGGNVESITRVFGDWSVKTGDQGKAMDKLFRASQATKVPVADLSDLLVKFGGPLRQLGFSMDESTALIGKFKAEGVNTELVMGSLRIALGKAAKAGKDPQEEFKRTAEAIKSAGDAGTANRLAIELFGAKAGPDMAAAIREGRFEIGDLQKTIAGGKDTIMGASKDTQDLGEKWQIFKNKILVGLEPVATGVFNAVGKAADLLGPALNAISAAVRGIAEMFSRADSGGRAAGGTLATLQRAGFAFGQLWNTVIDVARAVWDRFGERITTVVGNTITMIRGWVTGVVTTLTGVSTFISGVFSGDWGRAWEGIRDIVSGVWQVITTLIGAALAQIAAVAGIAWEGLKTLAGAAWDGIKQAIMAPVNLAESAIGDAWKSIKSTADRAWDGFKTLAGKQWDEIKGAIASPIHALETSIGNVWGSLKSSASQAWTDIKTGIGGFASDVRTAVEGAFEGAVNKVIDFLNNIISAANMIPGVNLKEIAHVGGDKGKRNAVPGLAEGGTVSYREFARGFNVKKPMVVIGEEGDRGHDEFVIPTNPAYRSRALGLYSQLGERLGVPGFAFGGILGDAVKFLSGGVSKAVSGITSKLPNPVTALPDWIVTLGRSVISDVKTWIKNKVQGLWDDKPGKIAAMVDFMNGVHAKGYPYVYGGGHGSFAGPYDCSGLVSAVLHSAGLIGSPMTTDGLKTYGESGAGEMVTIGVRGSTGRNAHTMMRIGDRYLESGSGHGARWVSGWSGSFPIKRHPKGFAMGGIVDQLLRPDLVGWGLARGGVLPYVGAYERGGIIPADGMAHVHKGERVIPADQAGAPTFDVHVHVDDPTLRNLVRVEITQRERDIAQQVAAGSSR